MSGVKIFLRRHLDVRREWDRQGEPRLQTRRTLRTPRARAGTKVCWRRSISVPAASLAVHRVEVLKAREVGEVGHVHGTCRTIALLGDDDLRLALEVFVLAVVVLLAMDERNHVRILLNGAGFAQVREQRLLVAGALFASTREL